MDYKELVDAEYVPEDPDVNDLWDDDMRTLDMINKAIEK